MSILKWNFNKKMSIPTDALADVLWWESNVEESFSPLRLSPVYTTFHSDDSFEGWGGTAGMTHIGDGGLRLKCLTTSMPWSCMRLT